MKTTYFSSLFLVITSVSSKFNIFRIPSSLSNICTNFVQKAGKNMRPHLKSVDLKCLGRGQWEVQHHASSKRLLQLCHLEIAQGKSPWSSPFHRFTNSKCTAWNEHVSGKCAASPEWVVCKCGLLFLGEAFCYTCFGKKQSILSEASCENDFSCRLIFMLVRCVLT